MTDVRQAREAAPALQIRERAPLRYVVKKGDTLWSIAGYYLKNPWQWPVLWYDNPQIKDPHRIYPGDVLKLVWVAGQPRLTATGGDETLRPRVRSEPLKNATPTIPFAAIRTFLNGPRVVDAQQINTAPYVVAFTGEHLVGAAGEGAFVKGLRDSDRRDWQIVHIGKTYRDPDTGEILGYEAVPTARATLRKPGGPALLDVVSNDRETLVGDRLLPRLALTYQPDFVPHAPPRAVAGSIIAVFDGVSQVGQHAIVTLDRGTDAGLDAGTVLQIMQDSRTVPDPHGPPDSTVVIPPQPAGLMMVFEATPRVSYALVMEITQPVRVLDRFASPGQPGV
ncbi:MAG TPA: LysM peptidoglycan-binding domain-containing protein [Nevskiaceae bacterium]